MLTNITRTSLRVPRSLLRKNRVHQRGLAGISEKLSKKEKVEEDRYMRAQEEVWKEKLRTLRAQQETEREEELHIAVIEPVKLDVAKLLSKSGDKLSDEGLEMIAKWKLDL